jgi:hypothetical protein
MAQPVPTPSTSTSPAARTVGRAGKPFFGLIDSVIVEDAGEFEFDGSVSRKQATAVWTWMFREIARDLIDPDAPQDDPATLKALDGIVPDLLARAKLAIAAAAESRDRNHAITVQLGGEDEVRRLPVVLNALRCRGMLEKAKGFGRATNGMGDDAALAAALQSMPWSDPAVAALLMHTAVGQVANPTRLVVAIIKLAGGATELAIERAGYEPVIDAILSHAQNQIPALGPVGTFADIDLTCRAIDRFHRLIRAINGYIELARGGRWATAMAGIISNASARLEPKVRDVAMDLNLAMRRHREGHDRLDSAEVLNALNGVYVLATVRDSRDSLALNAVFDRSWQQVGQALEIHLQRNLDLLRANPGDRIVAERLDAAIKMAELRFNPEYADVLRRAKETALRSPDRRDP